MPMAESALLEPQRLKTFAQRIRHKDNLAVHLVRTYDKADRPCWFLLKADERSLVKLEHTAHDDMIDLTQFGEVVASGWGHEPDERTLKEFYGSQA